MNSSISNINDNNEILLAKNTKRFVLFPIKYNDMYPTNNPAITTIIVFIWGDDFINKVHTTIMIIIEITYS
jgi:hypothetical protein